MKRRAPRLAVLLLLLLSRLALAQPASAPSEDLQKAKARFEAAESFYKDKEYDRALELYREAYELSGRPSLLFNMGQCARLLDRPAEALEYYRHFLEEVPDNPYRAEVEERIAELEGRLPDGPGSTPAPAPASSAAPLPSVAPGEAPALLVPGGLALLGAGLGATALALRRHFLADDGVVRPEENRRLLAASLAADLSFAGAAATLALELRRRRVALAPSPLPGGAAISLGLEWP